MDSLPIGCVAVIFTSVRRADAESGLPADRDGYVAMADDMAALAAQQPGYLGMDSVRDPATQQGITVAYWVDDASARAWKRHAEHLEAQRRGRDTWYSSYSVVVAEVMRAYGHPPD